MARSPSCNRTHQGPVKLILLAIVLLLQGCAAVTVASVGVWGATGKTVTDHSVGAVINRDCKTTRLLDGDYPCQDIVSVYNRNPF